MKLAFEAEVFKEGDDFVAHAKAFDVSSCGQSPDEALKSLLEAISLFFETTQEMGTFEQVLVESGYSLKGDEWSREDLTCDSLEITDWNHWEPSRRFACVEI